MRTLLLLAAALAGYTASAYAAHSALATDSPAPAAQVARKKPMADAPIELITLDPGHFHAALIQRELYPGVATRAHVYAPLGQDLLDHLGRVLRFNERKESPTRWELEVHTGPDFLERMTREKPGNVVVISGRNRGKIDAVRAATAAGLNSLVDKPWILGSAELPQLQSVLDLADQQQLIALDIMTERFEVTSLLQRELVNDEAVFGKIERGTTEQPGVYMESVHHLLKTVAGVPNIRPTWFFDTAQQGEGSSDIGTHLVDLVQWTLFPEQALDYKKDIEIVDAQRWPTRISREDFERVTREKEFPAFLAKNQKGGFLECFLNNLVTYKVRGIHTRLNVIWDYQAPAGAGDTHYAVYRGSQARIEVRQGKAEKWRTELYVIPTAAVRAAGVERALRQRLSALSAAYPGLSVELRGTELRVVIPEGLRTSHEQHFGQVARRFFELLKNPSRLPAWEKPNMLAKYWVTTRGTELSRKSPVKVAKRLAP